MPEQRRAYFLREGDKVTLLIEESQEIAAGLLANGEDVYCVLQEEDEYQEKSEEEPWISFGEMVALAIALGIVIFWLPVGFLLLWFLGF